MCLTEFDQKKYADSLYESGRIEGEARGEARGIDISMLVMQKLFAAGRVQDAEKASKDKEYLLQVAKDFSLSV